MDIDKEMRKLTLFVKWFSVVYFLGLAISVSWVVIHHIRS